MAKNIDIKEKLLLSLINGFKEDEHLKRRYLNEFFKYLGEDFIKEFPPQFNIFDSINLLNHENYNSNLFANFLEIKFKYNENKISFAKLFLEYLNKEFSWEFNNLENIKIEDIEIVRELSTEERKRIDIFIGYKKEFAVIIENKIWAEDGYKQLENYYIDVKNKGYDKIYMIYLTPYEREPNEESLPKKLYKEEGSELYGKFKNIRHEEIGNWINDSILKNEEFSFLHNEDKENNKYNYKLLKSALIQIINNELSISQGDNMTSEKIKKILEENIFKDIKTEEDADEYITMFKSVIPLLDKKKKEIRKAIIEKDIQPYLKFTKEVANYLSKEYKEGKDYALLSDEDIINDMSYYGYPHHIEFNINDIGIWLESCYGDDGIQYYFGIFTEDENKINQIKKKQLKTAIENILNNNEEKGWIFISYIKDIEKDNPKKVAQAMIDLYELLKKEIK